MTIQVTEIERDTIIAALRLWQWALEQDQVGLFGNPRGGDLLLLAENGREGRGASLNADQIDALCERANGQKTADVASALRGCLDQIGQMRRMFDDADGAIAAAVEDGEAALENL